jgi:hypothetical protein
MSRIYWMVLSVAILTIFALYMNWFAFDTVNDTARDKTKIEMTVDKGKVKEDVSAAKQKTEEIGKKAAEGAKDVAEKFVTLPQKNGAQIELEQQKVEMQPGATVHISVSRTDAELNRLQLGLIPSSGSNLLASGGLFNTGETRSTISIEAPKDAHDGTVEVVANGKAQIITVTVIQNK